MANILLHRPILRKEGTCGLRSDYLKGNSAFGELQGIISNSEKQNWLNMRRDARKKHGKEEQTHSRREEAFDQCVSDF